MRKCMNCKRDCRDTDLYCRNCGCSLKSNKHYILINVFTVFVGMGIIGLIVLSIAAYVMSA